MKKKIDLSIDNLKEKLSDNKLALNLIDEAIFMKETLNELKEKIQAEGVVTIMQQGTYEIDRENPALKSYNTTIKNYNSVIKQINDMIPKVETKTESDGFDEL